MAIQIQSTTFSDLDAVVEALLTGFNAAPDASFVDRRLLEWKYFESGPRWEGTRSYLLRKGDAVQAHCGVLPVPMEFAGGIVTCLCFLDWVGSQKFPGAGVLLKQKIMSFAETAMVVGGTADTRAIIPRLNYNVVGEVGVFARVVRPWKQFLTRPTEGIGKGAARLARNTMWSRATGGAIPEDWSAVRLQSFDSDFAQVLNRPARPAHPTPERSSDYLNYWLRCPASEVAGFALLKGGRIRGYFMLTRMGGQARIIDIRLAPGEGTDSPEQTEWNAAYALAGQMAKDDPGTCEILAMASTEFAQKALLSSGFRQKGSLPFSLYDPKGKLSAAPAVFWNMIDGDIAYLYDPASPYIT